MLPGKDHVQFASGQRMERLSLLIQQLKPLDRQVIMVLFLALVAIWLGWREAPRCG